MACDYVLCGLRVRSALAMPELLPWNGDDRPPDVEISFEPIREPAEPPVFIRTFSKLWADGTYILTLDNVGRFYVGGGCRVLVNPAPGAQEFELRLFILGTSLGVLCHQRGLYPLHASSVNIDGTAVIFAGNTGAGKSSLAAALGARGHPIVADDVSVFDPASMSMLPAYPQRKLTRDVLEVIGLRAEGLESTRPGTAKFRVPSTAGFDSAPLRPSRIYVIEKNASGQSCSFARMPLPLALTHLTSHMYRRASGVRIQPREKLFESVTRLAQIAPVFLLSRRHDAPLSDLDKLAASVESHVRQTTR
jgi:hypothetical protein